MYNEQKNQSVGLTVYPGGGAEILGGYNVLLLGNCSAVSKDARTRKARKCRDAQRAGAGHTFPRQPPMNPQGGSDAICAAGAQSMPRERHLTVTGSKLQQQSTVRYRERRSRTQQPATGLRVPGCHAVPDPKLSPRWNLGFRVQETKSAQNALVLVDPCLIYTISKAVPAYCPPRINHVLGRALIFEAFISLCGL
ncbi:hypothetical protein QR685DRAFT_583801 [Neurospora intermedia]|uniref:Uncharacterized protein n=1 Tax=Neurospora intermedia TaxID=5142 RepID=A0ABR3DL21_NEUIN